ncbi:MAG: M56 family metallopeptidase [Paenibacillaceae bacterium]|jgi:beta-lactamase regulating signal transducer with metallopeptidase domain|nr:M56 family metallopeptidase [Paenibacillaceae bacterium]
MSSSLILTNCFFCGLAALSLIPLLRYPNFLVYKKGVPLFIAVFIVFLKMLLPYEYSFTHTIASRTILPFLKNIEAFTIYNNELGNVIKIIWLIIALLLFTFITSKHRKLIQILSLVQETEDKELNQLLTELCNLKHLRKKPKLIQMNVNTGPFIVGFLNPIIVFPYFNLSLPEKKFVLMHELEHLNSFHIIIKYCIEVVTIIYWWNPVLWIFRREVLRALELQADTQVLQNLSNNSRLSYLETLIKLSRIICQRQDNSILTLSFSLKNSLLEYRIKSALKFNFVNKQLKIVKYKLYPLLFTVSLMILSFFYTFESYNINQTNVEGTFTVNAKTDYFVERQDNTFDLYIKGEYVVTMQDIPGCLVKLPVHR